MTFVTKGIFLRMYVVCERHCGVGLRRWSMKKISKSKHGPNTARVNRRHWRRYKALKNCRRTIHQTVLHSITMHETDCGCAMRSSRLSKKSGVWEEQPRRFLRALILTRSGSSVPRQRTYACNKDVYRIIIAFESEIESIERLRCCA